MHPACGLTAFAYTSDFGRQQSLFRSVYIAEARTHARMLHQVSGSWLAATQLPDWKCYTQGCQTALVRVSSFLPDKSLTRSFASMQAFTHAGAEPPEAQSMVVLITL